MPTQSGAANIEESGRRRRLLIGVAGFAAGVTAVGVFLAIDAPAWWAVFVFPAFGLGALGVLQARAWT